MKHNIFYTSCLMAVVTGSLFLGSAQAALVPGDSASNNTAATAFNVDGYFTTEYVEDIESGDGTNNSTSIPHITDTDLTADSALNVISFTVASAGTFGIFDIDDANFLDSFISLLDTDGATVLAFNDDSDFTGPGDPVTGSNRNSFLTYTFSAPGLYFLEVGAYPESIAGHPSAWDSGDADFNFTLHVSLGDSPSVSAVPVPSAVWLFGSGLLGLIGIAKRKRA